MGFENEGDLDFWRDILIRMKKCHGETNDGRDQDFIPYYTDGSTYGQLKVYFFISHQREYLLLYKGRYALSDKIYLIPKIINS